MRQLPFFKKSHLFAIYGSKKGLSVIDLISWEGPSVETSRKVLSISSFEKTEEFSREERRIEITKVAAKYAENSKIAVRNIRRDYIENVRKLQKNGEISEDQKHQDELLIQQITDEIISNIDDVFSNKEKEILDN